MTEEQRHAIEWAIGMASQHNIHKEPLRALLASPAIDAAGASSDDVREKLCTGSHITCKGREYCLGEPSCRDLAAKESGND